jgi:hypothetical protein
MLFARDLLRLRGESFARREDACVAIIVHGSSALSRTTSGIAVSIRGGDPDQSATQIHERARRDLRSAAERVVESAADLPLTLATAQRLNRLVTRGTVLWDRGELVGTRAQPIYAWLESPEAQRLARTDPVTLAEQVHFEISAVDAFPDGNGRTARLMADLILLRSGRAPAFFGSRAAYFAGANARAASSRERQAQCFRRAASRGAALVERLFPSAAGTARPLEMTS